MGRSRKPRSNSAATTWSNARTARRQFRWQCDSRHSAREVWSKCAPSCPHSMVSMLDKEPFSLSAGVLRGTAMYGSAIFGVQSPVRSLSAVPPRGCFSRHELGKPLSADRMRHEFLQPLQARFFLLGADDPPANSFSVEGRLRVEEPP